MLQEMYTIQFGPDNLDVIAASNIGAVILDKPSATVFVACRGTADLQDILVDIEGTLPYMLCVFTPCSVYFCPRLAIRFRKAP